MQPLLKILKMSRTPKFVTGLLSLIWLTACIQDPESFDLDRSRVAHAGGGIDGKAFTNSIEALDLNYAKGFRLFEIDFSWTSDQELVCLHDWEISFEQRFGFKAEIIPDLQDFKSLVTESGDYNACTLEELAMWLDQHPDAFLITDIYINRKTALKMIRKTIANSSTQVIPQFTQPDEFKSIRRMGFEKTIWTIHSFKGSDEDVIRHAGNIPIFAITMPPDRAQGELAGKLETIGVFSYVHTINDENEANTYIDQYHLTDIYTDFLPPIHSAQN
jgi:glycerophosphoryl diester phosphodiesterase